MDLRDFDDRSSFEARESALKLLFIKYLNLALRYKLLIAAICIVALFAGFVITFLTPRLYTASTTIMIERAVPKVLSSQSNLAEGLNDSQFYQTQYELIRSRSLAERVATRLNLAQTDFVGTPPQSIFSPLGLRPDAADEGTLEPATIKARHNVAVRTVMHGLSVQPFANSSLVRVRFQSRSPQWAQRISIAMAESYEQSTLDRRYNASQHAREFLDERLQQLKLKLADSEEELIKYAQKEGIVDLDNTQPGVSVNLQAVQNALASTMTERIRNEQLWEYAQSRNGMGLPQVLDDTLIQAARERRSKLLAAYQERLGILKPAFPEMVSLQAQIAESEKQIGGQVAIIKDSIKAIYEASLAEENALRDKLEEVKSQMLDLRGRSVTYTILLREVDTARALYDGLLQQFRELGVAGDVDTNNVSIIDRADLPTTQDSPSLRSNLMLALLLALGASAAIIAVLEALDDTFKSAESVEETLALTVLGVTPYLPRHNGEGSWAPLDLKSPMAEAYRSLRTALQFSTADGVPKTLLVTSSRQGEGKSTTSVRLAATFAQLNMNVLLVDADLRNPGLHKLLGVENTIGLTNFLAGGISVSESIQRCAIEGVCFISAGPQPPDPAELLAGPRFNSLLTAASAKFDVVIVDGPPVMGLADAPIIGSLVAGTLFVVAGAKTRRGIARDAIRRLRFVRARVVGVLLNKLAPNPQGYGHVYDYDYEYDYGRERYSYGGPQTPPLPAGVTEIRPVDAGLLRP